MNLFARTGILVCLMAFVSLINPDIARAQNFPNCAWPIEGSPEGYGNIALPDSFARYFMMPFEPQYETMTIKGSYPHVRYFSLVVYDGRVPADIAGSLFDAQIAPDPGGVNPFVQSQTTYTVVLSRTAPTSGNTIKVSPEFDWVIIRLYVPAADPSLTGQALVGGMPLPTILLTGNGATRELPVCSPVNKLPVLSAFLQTLFPPGSSLTGDEGTPSSDRLWFGAPKDPPIRLFPNPHNKYIAMFPGDRYQPGRIIAIHGKAPGFPDTFGGSPIWVPARGFGTADMRYWSLCNNDLAQPFPVVNCITDLTTDLQGGDYTIVISDDLLRPSWLKPHINWLPWGDEQYLKVVFFRNMLPSPNFHFAVQDAIAAGCTFNFNLPQIPSREEVDKAGQCAQKIMGDYYPVAVWCDKSAFEAGGWQACIEEH